MNKQNNEFSSDLDHEALINQARKSGLSYNEAKEWIAKTTGGRGTNVYSNTDIKAVRKLNEQSEMNKRGFQP